MNNTLKKFGNYNARIVRKGDRYGLNDCLTHDEDDLMVEFYLDSHHDIHGPRGFFVSRYYIGTLLNQPGFYGHEHKPGTGLCLYGGNQYEDSINVPGKDYEQVLAYLEELQ